MFCTSCGKKIQDDSKFCPFCGQGFQGAGQAQIPGAAQPVAGTGAAGVAPTAQATAPAAQATPMQATPAQPAVAAAPTAQQATGGIDAQVKASRGSSRRKMPMMVFVVLVTMALAGAAFAAAYIYTNFFADNGEQATQTEEAAQEATEEQGPEAVYNDKLRQWVAAAIANWPDESSTGDADLANVSDVASGRANMAPGVPRELLDDKTVQFAYKDLNGDSKPELIIAVPYEEEFSDIDFAPIAIYTTDSNDNVISVTDGIGSQTSIWMLYKNGYLQCGGGGNAGTQLLYQIADGAVVLAGEYSNQDLMTGAVSMPDRGENYTYSDFEWTDLVAMGDLVNDEIIAAEQAEASAAVDSVLSSMHSYENDYFYVDSESNVDTTVTDNGNGTWTVQWEAKPGARDTGGRVIVHMGGTPTQYAQQVGTASNGQLIWVEGVAGGTCGTFGVK